MIEDEPRAYIPSREPKDKIKRVYDKNGKLLGFVLDKEDYRSEGNTNHSCWW